MENFPSLGLLQARLSFSGSLEGGIIFTIDLLNNIIREVPRQILQPSVLVTVTKGSHPLIQNNSGFIHEPTTSGTQ